MGFEWMIVIIETESLVESNLIFEWSVHLELERWREYMIKMIKLCLSIFLSIGFVVSSNFLSDSVQVFRFTKAQDGSDEYNFEWAI